MVTTAITATEDVITAILAALLKVPAASLARNASFSDLGLDSLLGIRLVGRLEEHLGRDIDPVLILDHPSIEALAAHLEHAWTPLERLSVPADAPNKGCR
jgi:acyl carrier protein